MDKDMHIATETRKYATRGLFNDKTLYLRIVRARNKNTKEIMPVIGCESVETTTLNTANRKGIEPFLLCKYLSEK